MKKLLFLFTLTFIFINPNISSAQLVAGDIAIIGYNTDTPDGFAFITFVDIPAGDVVFFAEDGWTASGWVGNGEAHLKWTSPIGGTSAGTVITVIETSNDVFSSTVGTIVFDSGVSFSLATGDQILVYTGSTVSPTFITGIHGDYTVNYYNPTTGWASDATFSNSRSEIPTGLTNNINALALFPGVTEQDNAKYVGTLTGTVADVKTAIFDLNNWVTDNNTPYNIDADQYSPNLTLSSGDAGYWTGAVSTDWNTAGNWDDSNVPTSATDVLIRPTSHADVTNAPTISNDNQDCNNFTIQSGATITLSSNKSLTVSGDLQDEGGIISAGSGSSVIVNGDIKNAAAESKLITSGTGGLIINGDINVEQ